MKEKMRATRTMNQAEPKQSAQASGEPSIQTENVAYLVQTYPSGKCWLSICLPFGGQITGLDRTSLNPRNIIRRKELPQAL